MHAKFGDTYITVHVYYSYLRAREGQSASSARNVRKSSTVQIRTYLNYEVTMNTNKGSTTGHHRTADGRHVSVRTYIHTCIVSVRTREVF